MSIRQHYSNLCSRLREINHLSGISALLDWDQNVMMPDGAAESRASQMSVLAGVIHEKSTTKELGLIIDEIEKHPEFKSLNEYEQANVRDAKRSFLKDTKVPNELAKKIAELQSRGNTVWVEAREKSDFKMFAPILKEWIALLKQKALFIDPSMPPYQLLLDDYERGAKIEEFDKLFSELKQGLLPLIKSIKSKPKPESSFLQGQMFDVDEQKKLNHRIAVDLGFNTAKGRLDVSVHPFTGGPHPTDVRMTTRYKDGDLIEGITGTIHETGHALYEQGRNSEYFNLPVSEALSMGLHESQSLFWERMIGLNPRFWKHYWPIVQLHFPQLSHVEWESFYRVINTSYPGFIRVEADEVTYPMHIILRYEIEKGLFDGTIKVDNLPQVWNAKMQEYLGIIPDNDKLGVLQDTHWAVGLFGYFPTYTLGAIYASQFYAAMKKDIPNLEDLIEQGRFESIREWLGVKVHRVGSLYPSGDVLVRNITGGPRSAEYFLKYLNEKYSKLYDLNR